MNELEYRNFYDRVGKMNGWDFSRVKCQSEGAAWDFYDVVTQNSKKSDMLLDIGTGGGEALLSIVDAALLLIGIDHSMGMIQTAQANVSASKASNVRMLYMDAAHIQFPEGFFQVISNRHSGFDPREVARVLAEGGCFLTQQVGEADKMNLKLAFGRGQAFEVPDGTLMNLYMTQLEEVGFRDIQSFEYDAIDYYETYEDLVFLLKHTPIIPNFGQTAEDFTILHQFIEEHQTSKGIRTNSKRFMIIARK
ncbi:SAM-dependent methyltransferase [Paenibacillus selenitireducens]|uniref:SAM-dependent methyltransferase n=1 Tax=Paenibacillus selenitireducens TaxID=1324314 RepID=A0A1T2XG05_9BACL|nr:class I SAM-dependent methyltransferase [Paenibacillus selenitireducens]OPA78606.1 SAM-dependent methyltransferase [Paenibacillus selenitireducens]